jgi:hypothetical protein
MNFLSQKDKISFIVIISYGIVGYLISRAFSTSLLFSSITFLVCVVFGFFVAKYLFATSLYKKIFIGVVFPFIFLLIVLIGLKYGSPQDQLIGSWSTEDDDEVQIVMNFVSNDSVYMSMSPYFEEVGYKYTVADKYLTLKRVDETLKWHLIEVSNQQFVLGKEDDRLIFYKE